MQLIVLSDSHGRSERFLRLVEFYQDTATAFLFTGDGASDAEIVLSTYPQLPLFSVRGNNDFGHSSVPYERVDVFQEDHTPHIAVLMEHGDALPYGSQGEALMSKVLRQKANIGLFGHTHVPYAKMENNSLVLNPGSLSYPRGGSQASYAIIEIDSDGIIHWKHLPISDLL